MKTYIVIYNKNSRGKNYSKKDLEIIFSKHELNSKIFVTNDIKDVEIIIQKFNDPNKYLYCAIGGDGTLNSLINALLMNNIDNPEVACIASGSGSDFLRTFAMPRDINQAIIRIKNNNNYVVDASLIESKSNSRYFINVLNYGFLAETVNLSEKLPNIVKRFRYPISFWLKIIFASATETYVDTDRGEFNGDTFNISVCNAQYFGGGWNISPKSSLQDGLFNVQIFAVTKFKAMKIFFLAKRGLHLREPNIFVKKTSNIRLLTKQAIEIDGDYFGNGPAEIFIKKRAIRFKI